MIKASTILALILIPASLMGQGAAALAGTAYYLTTTGNDANPGTSGSPWLSPNHSVNCADIIYASSGTYSAANFQNGKWGTVNCAAGKTARLLCATFDGCKITAGAAQFGILIDKSNWSVQGWEVNASTVGANGCFDASPSGAANIHHIIFANDIANGCNLGGFGAYNNGVNGVDYFAVVGSIAYDAAQGSVHCYSGISVYQPVKVDSVSGTHILAAGNFSFGNTDPAICNGTANTDGDGVIFDTFDGSQGVGTSYDQQGYIYNNLNISNGGWGLEVQNNSAGSSHAPIFAKYNTMWGNRSNTSSFSTTLCADTVINVGVNITYQNNIVQTTVANSCPTSNPVYGVFVYTGDGTDTVQTNWVQTASGNNTGSFASPGFSFGSNTTGTSPAFAAPSAPGAPSCSGKASVPDCMTTVIANFTPTAGGASSYGIQPVVLTNGSDSLFPRWVCGQIPAGLVTTSC